MTENEMREIEELESALTIIYGDDDETEIDWYSTARASYENGIRKIPTGAVVISKEEYYDLIDKNGERSIKQMVIIGDAIDRTRKATAQDYHDKVEQEIDSYNFESTRDYECMKASNNEIVKEFGVEVEE